jgi:hypothetical protein
MAEQGGLIIHPFLKDKKGFVEMYAAAALNFAYSIMACCTQHRAVFRPGFEALA